MKLGPSSVRSARWIIFIVVLACLFFVFGGLIFGPLWDTLSDRYDLYSFLRSCPANELRIKCYEQYESNEKVTLNFDTGKLSFEGKTTTIFWDLFWHQDPPQIFSLVFFPVSWNPKTLTAGQIVEIKKTLLRLSPPATAREDSYLRQNHLAFRDEGGLRTYHYNQTDLHGRTTHDLDKLFSLLNTPPTVGSVPLAPH
jgi:hypothetical protein